MLMGAELLVLLLLLVLVQMVLVVQDVQLAVQWHPSCGGARDAIRLSTAAKNAKLGMVLF
jgi:hypothetical protein